MGRHSKPQESKLSFITSAGSIFLGILIIGALFVGARLTGVLPSEPAPPAAKPTNTPTVQTQTTGSTADVIVTTTPVQTTAPIEQPPQTTQSTQQPDEPTQTPSPPGTNVRPSVDVQVPGLLGSSADVNAEVSVRVELPVLEVVEDATKPVLDTVEDLLGK